MGRRELPRARPAILTRCCVREVEKSNQMMPRVCWDAIQRMEKRKARGLQLCRGEVRKRRIGRGGGGGVDIVDEDCGSISGNFFGEVHFQSSDWPVLRPVRKQSRLRRNSLAKTVIPKSRQQGEHLKGHSGLYSLW